MSASPTLVGLPQRLVSIEVDGQAVRVPEDETLLAALGRQGVATPTLCYLENLTPVNACRVCVVEVAGQRTLAPACSRRVEDGMVVSTDSPRVRHSRRMVLELLASSVDLSLATGAIKGWMETYGVAPERYGPPAPPSAPGDREQRRPGHHEPPDGSVAATVAQPPKVQDDLYVRDYEKCILCYKCVQACGEDAQNTFAIAVAGRGFDARISTEHDVALPESACVYCGNCIGVCPTGALMPKSEWDLRQAGQWRPEDQHTTETICAFCGVGCSLELTVQDNRIVRADSPLENDITRGHLCVKGRFGFQHVQNLPDGS